MTVAFQQVGEEGASWRAPLSKILDSVQTETEGRPSPPHNAIASHHLAVTRVTERVGSLQTLVCTKDRRTFDRRMK